MLTPWKESYDTISTVSPSISHEVMGPDAMILVFSMLYAYLVVYKSGYSDQ